MFVNKTAALVGAVAVIGQAAALNIHRQEHGHLHQLEKKQDAVVWETVWDTVYVTGKSPAAQNTPAAVAATNVQPYTPAVVTPMPPTKPNKASNNHIAAPTDASASDSASGSGSNSGSGSISGSISGSSSGSGSVSSSKGPGFSGKRGLAYNDASLANLVGSSAQKGVCGWAYNWGQTPGNLDSQYSFVPTLWGRGPNNQNTAFLDSWPSSASKAVANGAKALFSFNEPDNKGQSNLDPSTAAGLHVEYMNPYSGKTLIASPSVSNSNIQGEGLDWLKSWVQQCKSKGCKYDFCNVHWYSPVSLTQSLFDHLEQAHKICDGKPVWLTEFAPVDASDAQTADFLTQVIPKLEALDYLHAYSYFMVGHNTNLQLLSSPSSLSKIGAKYVQI
ncbi:hypothetical protein E4U13_005801 [Claviceps humidiphila]|uniref:Asl1-like glycosyl hydrolase catalytic domain-containing protein n=1 Tax=Claviceps humidiphila TaxID=1294629 RepID=A0A9P7PVT8_9HYPO|nr:hypothetical protein E4U13_005801 [Claviceps humidiphila]